jgi:uncharacterized protein
MNLGGGLNRPRPSETDPPSSLGWTMGSLLHDLEVIGPIELQLDLVCTAPDSAFIAVLQDVGERENATNVTAGYLRAGLRGIDEAGSKPGAPVLPCSVFKPVPVGERVRYRIPLVPNARCFKAGHRIRLHLTTDDQDKGAPALLEFRHASVGASSFNTVFSSSRLLLPVLA